MKPKITYLHGLIFTIVPETRELLFLKTVLQTEVDFTETRRTALIRKAEETRLDIRDLDIEFIKVDDIENSGYTSFFYAIPVDYESLKELAKENSQYQLVGEKHLGEYKEIVGEIKKKIEKTKL